jgi:LytS/YehU family sensor histidine kinase
MSDANGGIGLANVRRRLGLCYGKETKIDVKVVNDITSVAFTLPVNHSLEVTTAAV